MVGFLFYILAIVAFAAAGVCAGMEELVIALILFFAGFLLIIAGFLYTILPRKHVRKRRTEYIAPFHCSKERVKFAIELFMKEKEFNLIKYNDEEVYKKGNGWLVARKFIKYTINDDNTVTLEGWLSKGLGDIASTEINLKGFYGFIVKKDLDEDIRELKFRIGFISE